MQDYLGKYQDLRDEWKARRREGDKEDITDDVVNICGIKKDGEVFRRRLSYCSNKHDPNDLIRWNRRASPGDFQLSYFTVLTDYLRYHCAYHEQFSLI